MDRRPARSFPPVRHSPCGHSPPSVISRAVIPPAVIPRAVIPPAVIPRAVIPRAVIPPAVIPRAVIPPARSFPPSVIPAQAGIQQAASARIHGSARTTTEETEPEYRPLGGAAERPAIL